MSTDAANSDAKEDAKETKDELVANSFLSFISQHKVTVSILFLLITTLLCGTVLGVAYILNLNSSSQVAKADAIPENSSATVENEAPVVAEQIEDVESQKIAEDEMKVARKEAYFYTIRPIFVVNINAKKARFLQVGVELVTRQEEVVDEIMANLPFIKNDLVSLFASKKAEDIQDAKGKEKLRQEALKIVKNIMLRETGKDKVDDILFTSFVVQ